MIQGIQTKVGHLY